MRFHKNILSLLLTITLLSSCANIVAPTGGQGKKNPPTITKSSVSHNQTNFHSDRIELNFSEYMNRPSVIENLIINPTIKYTYK
jgi:PBP1b-binding outer membrane lipoprotein LpoB